MMEKSSFSSHSSHWSSLASIYLPPSVGLSGCCPHFNLDDGGSMIVSIQKYMVPEYRGLCLSTINKETEIYICICK
jgi:hypothetical protein